MLTYNQQDFIAQAIEGVINQKANFNYKLVIGEDLSIDNTREICEFFAEKYADKIQLLPSLKKYGVIENFIRTYKRCDGKYIAFCDGDDYWTDPFKLQKQIDFLEMNPDFGIVFTSFKFLFPDGLMLPKDYSRQKADSSFEDLVFGNYIPAVTAVFINKNSKLPEWLKFGPFGDWPIYLWVTKDGAKIKFLNEITAVYRREIGVSEKMKSIPSKVAQENLRIISSIKEDNNFDKKKHIKESLYQHQLSLLAEYFREGKFKESIMPFSRLFFSQPLKLINMYLYLIKKTIIKHKTD